ncbi:DNA ligase 1-like [Capsicum chacoense]
MGKKTIHSKCKAGSSRKRKIEAAKNVSKRNKINEKLFESDPDLKEISDYAESSEDVLPERSVSGDSEESEESGRNSDDGDNDPLSVPSLSRFIFVERYDLRTIMDEVRSFPVKISVRSRMSVYREFKQVLVDQELKKRFKRSYFGRLRNLSEHLKFNGQLVHYFLLRRVKRDKMRHEMWFCVHNKLDCFGLEEFCLITRLKCSSYPSE